MGKNGRKIAEEKFDIEKRIDKLLELYNHITLAKSKDTNFINKIA